VARVQQALEQEQPFALAFVDMRIAAGLDGLLETIERMWAIDPKSSVVICSAHSDYDWCEVRRAVCIILTTARDQKPFEPIGGPAVCQPRSRVVAERTHTTAPC